MPDISKINAVAVADIEKLDSILAANIEKVNGLTFATAAPFTGLLDTYTGAAAGYSTRRLASSATVLMRVRRDTAGGTGDDDEADVAYDSNNQLSLDSAISNASEGVTATTLGQFLNVGTVGGTTYTNPDSLTVTASCFTDTWYDQSGNANHAEQTTQGSQPQIHDGTVDTDLITLNGKPSINQRTDNYNGTFQLTGLTSSTLTIIQVVDTSNSAGGSNIDTGRALTSGNVVASFRSQMFLYQGISLSGAISKPSAQTLGMWFFKATDEGYQNGTQVITGNAGTSAPDSVSTLLGQSLDKRICVATQELIIYESDQSSNRTGIDENINTEYLIYQPTDAPTSGLLATYTGAAAAYSVRQLSDKAVICMRIRRDMGAGNPGDDDEINIGFDANGDLDTQAIADFCGTGTGYVTRWWDQSVNGNHADQPVGGTGSNTSQPQIYNGTAVIEENGKPALEFDTHKLGEFSLPLSQPFTFNFVGRYAGDTASAFAPFFGSRDTTFVSFMVRGGNWMQQAPSLPTNSTTVDTNQHNWFLLYDGSSSFVGVDGGTAATSNPGTAALENFAIGARGIDGATSQLRYFQELVLWPSDQDTAGNRTGIETNIDTYYQIPGM